MQCLSQGCHLSPRGSLRITSRITEWPRFPWGSSIQKWTSLACLGDAVHYRHPGDTLLWIGSSVYIKGRQRRISWKPLLPEGAKMRVSVRFLPENFQLPEFKLSAIFCQQLLFGKSPEKNVTACRGLREWNSRAFGTSPVCVRLLQLEHFFSLQFRGFNQFTVLDSDHHYLIPDSSFLKQ